MLPTTETKVSRTCLGTMSFGAHVPESDAHAVMDAALEQGINFFDTAEMYAVPPTPEAYGLTEKIIGRWLTKSKARDQIVLATKIVGPSRGMSWVRDGKTRCDEKCMREALEGSFKRMGTDYVDLYQIHWPDRHVQKFGERYYQPDSEEAMTDIHETLKAVAVLQKEGKIKHFGLSNETPWGLMKFLEIAKQENLPRIVTTQNNYSLLTRSYDMSLSEVSLREDVGLLAYSPLGYGVLGGRYLNGNKPAGGRFTTYPGFVPRYQSPEVEKIVKKYKALAEDHGMTLPELALAFVYQRSYMTSGIIGPSNVAQLESCVKALDFELSSEVLAEIDAIDDQYPNSCP